MSQPDRHQLEMIPLDEACLEVALHRVKMPRQYEGRMTIVSCVAGLVELAKEHLREPFVVGDRRYEFVRAVEGAPAIVLHETEAK